MKFHSRMITFNKLDFINNQEALALELRMIFMLLVLSAQQNSPGKETVDVQLLFNLAAGVDH